MKQKLLPLATVCRTCIFTMFLFQAGCALMQEPSPAGLPFPPPADKTPAAGQAAEPPVSTPGAPAPARPAAKPPPAALTGVPTGPGGSLYEMARKAIAGGNYKQAEIAIERALRVEPANGYYWYTLGEIKYRQQKSGEAKHFLFKSKSVAGTDSRLIRLNNNLISLCE